MKLVKQPDRANDKEATDVHDWNQLEQCQMKATARQQTRIRKMEDEMRQKYREELDLLVQVKNNKENIQSPSLVVDPPRGKRVDQQLQFDDILKQMERKRMSDSLAEAERRRREAREEADRERNQYQRDLQRNLSIQQTETIQRQNARAIEAKASKSYYEMALERKREQQAQERFKDKDYFRQEKDMLEKMSRENSEFLQNIRFARKRCDEVAGCYEQLDCQKKRMQAEVDKCFVERGGEQHAAREAQRDRAEQERNQIQRSQVTQGLQKQIQLNQFSKEVVAMEELRRDHELANQNLDLLRQNEEQRWRNKRAAMSSTAQTLDYQIAEKAQKQRQDNLLSHAEEELNCFRRDGEQVVECPEKSANNIPGFCVQQDRKKMLRVISQDARATEQLLKNALEHSQVDDNHRNRRSNLIKRAVGASTDNFRKTRTQFSSEYDFLRFKNWSKDFNIISNEPFQT
jgi:hypothetical protein